MEDRKLKINILSIIIFLGVVLTCLFLISLFIWDTIEEKQLNNSKLNEVIEVPIEHETENETMYLEYVVLLLLAYNYNEIEEFFTIEEMDELIEKESITEIQHAVYPIEKDNAIQVTATAYTNCPTEGWGNPNITATGTRVREGIIAVSPDLFEEWGPNSQILLFRQTNNGEYQVIGTFTIEDRTNSRLRKTVDIFMFNKEKALQFGRKRMYALLIS